MDREKGKVVGGTRGNKILDYVSGAPNKEQIIEQAPNVFDYDELERYGFGVRIVPTHVLFVIYHGSCEGGGMWVVVCFLF